MSSGYVVSCRPGTCSHFLAFPKHPSSASPATGFLIVSISPFSGTGSSITQIVFVQLPDDLEQLASIQPLGRSGGLFTVTGFRQLVRDPLSDTLYVTANSSLFKHTRKDGTQPVSSSCLQGSMYGPLAARWLPGKTRSPYLYLAHEEGILEYDSASGTCLRNLLPAISLIRAHNTRPEQVEFLAASDSILYVKADGIWYSASLDHGDVSLRLQPSLRDAVALTPLSAQFQPYPDISCIKPPTSPVVFSVQSTGKTALLVQVDEERSNTKRDGAKTWCKDVPNPGFSYVIVVSAAGEPNCLPGPDCFLHRTRLPSFNVTGLQPRTRYSVFLSRSNRFLPTGSVSPPQIVQTGAGFPTAPQLFHVVPAAPDQVLLLWTAPKTLAGPRSQLRFHVEQSKQRRTVTIEGVSCPQDPCRRNVPKLQPNTKYTFRVSLLWVSPPTQTDATTHFNNLKEVNNL